MLVSNAGLPTIVGGAHSMDLERWQRDLSVNLTGSFRVVQACLRGMRERRFGRIVVISSFAARFGMPAQVAYSASKAGLIGMVKTVAAENAGLGITANAILPGLVASAGVKAMPQEIIDAWMEQIPTGRMVEPGRDRGRRRVLRLPGGGQRHRPGAPHRRGHDAQSVIGDQNQQRRPRAPREIVTADALAGAAGAGARRGPSPLAGRRGGDARAAARGDLQPHLCDDAAAGQARPTGASWSRWRRRGWSPCATATCCARRG